jgi:biofilm PGA synthesis N-glycosyltransferase PgaC
MQELTIAPTPGHSAARRAAPAAAAPPRPPLLPVTPSMPAPADLELALAALANTNEGMRHRAADSGQSDIGDMTRLLDVLLARIRAGALALSAARIDSLQLAGALIARQLDEQFDGRAPSPAALGRIRATLDAAAQVVPADSALPRCAPARRGLYLSVTAKFTLAVVGGLAWMVLSIILAQPWLDSLGRTIGTIPATFAIAGIAIVPGFMNAFLLIGLGMDRRPEHAPLNHYPALSILIAAYNEAASIEETVRSIALQRYPGKLDVIVVDDGSSDGTPTLVEALLGEFSWLTLLRMPKNGGKATALNHALQFARASLVVTVDADSYLYHDALQNIVQRYFEDPRNTRAVAGTVLVRNSRTSWITKAQEWDYFHGISAIKRVQSLFQGTLVAQGAFSLYDRATLAEVGGWPDCVGEDIVLTWAILKRGYRIGHSEEAYLFTNAPDTLRQFVRQRQRWSRGMIEGFKQHPDIMGKVQLSTFFVYWNLLFPLLDLAFTICFIPGIVFALFGHFDIVGPMTLALLPMGFAMNFMMYSIGNKSFKHKHLRVRRNLPGFFIYTLLYSLIMQPACLVGYASELLGTKKTWGTK